MVCLMTLSPTTEPGIFSELPCLRCKFKSMGIHQKWHWAMKWSAYLRTGARVLQEHSGLRSGDRKGGDCDLGGIFIEDSGLVCSPPRGVSFDMPLVGGGGRLVALLFVSNLEPDSLRGSFQVVNRMLHACRQVHGNPCGAFRWTGQE